MSRMAEIELDCPYSPDRRVNSGLMVMIACELIVTNAEEVSSTL